MYPVPSLAWFALPDFINAMDQRPVTTASLVLCDGSVVNWNDILGDDHSPVYTQLHHLTGNDHDVYLPYTPSDDFRAGHERHIRGIAEPALNRIQDELVAQRFENVDRYMISIKMQLWTLFASPLQNWRVSMDVIKFLGLTGTVHASFPLIVFWQSLYDKSVVLLRPDANVMPVDEYILAHFPQ